MAHTVCFRVLIRRQRMIFFGLYQMKLATVGRQAGIEGVVEIGLPLAAF